MAKKLTEMEIFTSALYNALGVGHKNAQTRRELCKRLGCSDRMLRKGIEILRLDYAILSRDDVPAGDNGCGAGRCQALV